MHVQGGEQGGEDDLEGSRANAVVEEALAFEDGEQAIRQAELTQQRDDGKRVRRRDDGADEQRGEPGEGGAEVCHCGDDEQRDEDPRHGEGEDQQAVTTQQLRVHGPGALEEQGGQEEEEHEVGVEVEVGEERTQADDEAGKDEREGVG